MDRLRYTSSARLGLWDFLPTHGELTKAMSRLLADNAHAVIEANDIIPTNDPSLASVTAICDKIIARGNPTLVDFDFERSLFNNPYVSYLRTEEVAEGPAVGIRLCDDLPFKPDDLVSVAYELLCMNYRSAGAGFADVAMLSPELRALASEEEDIFFEGLTAVFGDWVKERVHRQVRIGDLVEHSDGDDDLADNRVDFVFQLGRLRWVIEVDGDQHTEPGQMRLDQRRDDLLQKHGWRVHRISTHDIRSNLTAWLERLKLEAEKDEPFVAGAAISDSMQDIVVRSQIHSIAFYCIIVPLAVHRCLRGLAQLYLYGVLDSSKRQRILIMEEDIPVTVGAFRMLYAIWSRINALAPSTSPAPHIQLEALGDEPIIDTPPGCGIDVRHVAEPDGVYDAVLSHSFVLAEGHTGDVERDYLSKYPVNARIRRAVGSSAERALQWSEPVDYELADVERAIINQNVESPSTMPENKIDALRFFLRLVFRKRDFWDGQLHVILRLLQGKATIALLPTGGGKSLTYQLSGLMLPGMTIIIDPLIALMNDQVENLRLAGIDMASSISSQLDASERNSVMSDMGNGRLAFIFVSPERLQRQDFREQLRAVTAEFPVSLAVIDEAHCVSEWGHDFRPSYLHMPRNLQRFCSDPGGRAPTLVGLTGTASFAVLADMQMEMAIADEEAIVLPRSFDRPELQFDVQTVPMREKGSALKTFKRQLPRKLRFNPQRFYNIQGDNTNGGIVFCPHVNGSLGVTSVAGELGHNNIFAGSLPREFRGDWNSHKSRVQAAFKQNQIQEIVATKSFGMGIDKPNIRYTCHYTVPQSVEAFYQEAGRAGRNGIPSYAICAILYSDDNWVSALEILNEPDHQQAFRKLDVIDRRDRGDLLTQLWLLLNTYKGREQDKERTIAFLNRHIRAAIVDMPIGATNTREIMFTRNSSREDDERCIYRLMLLGVVQDYTVDWNRRIFEITVHRITPDEVKENLQRYLLNYKFADFANDAIREIPTDTIGNALKAASSVLIDFIYDEIVTKRKQALRTMGELCRDFTSDADFRSKILAYLQESEFSDELRRWIGREFNEVGVETIREVIGRVTTLEDAKRLVGTTRRMLDEDPQNIALRYLSMCARAQSVTESDSSVVAEVDALIIQIERGRETVRDQDELLVDILVDVESRRPEILERISDSIFRQVGGTSLARRLLHSKFAHVPLIRSHSIKLILAEVVRLAKSYDYQGALR